MIQIKDLIQSIAEKDTSVQTCAAKVIAVNAPQNAIHSPDDAFTVNVMRADGAVIKNVRLKASLQEEEQGIINIPKIDSWVLISIIDNLETRAFISQCSEVERTFIRFKSENNQYLEIDSNADQFHMVFKEVLNNIPGQPPTEFKSIASVSFNSLQADSNENKPNLITTFYDANGKTLSETLTTGQQQKTTLNSIKNDEPIERVSFDINTTADSIATLHFTSEDEESKQKIDITEVSTTIAINEDVTVVTLQENDLTITTDSGDGYSASIKSDEVIFMKEDHLLKLKDDKFTIKNSGSSLLDELGKLVDEIKLITVTTPVGPSGTPINVMQLDGLKDSFSNLLE
ncbi:hypothetical protein [Dokdonia sp.]|uniref:hypothetical protein n=1 Tax=Dokdonia sp. TaxID=2024995 RepID=UPI0032660B03